jgi:YkoY family integral membrane protein
MLDYLLDYSTNIGIDTLLLLPVLIALEAVLSADNAIALAAIAQGLKPGKQQQQALNVGLVIAFALRVILILTATWVLRFWQFEVLGAAYLLWLVYQHFTADEDDDHQHHGPRFASIWQAIPIIALTDLAFSLDSVTTAIALSRETWLVITGGLIGVVTLRFLAGLFIRWLDEYVYLEDAGFITVGFVALRLLLRVINEDLVPPEWIMVLVIAVLFIWGFSKRVEEEMLPTGGTSPQKNKFSSHADGHADSSTDQHSLANTNGSTNGNGKVDSHTVETDHAASEPSALEHQTSDGHHQTEHDATEQGDPEGVDVTSAIASPDEPEASLPENAPK